MTGQHARRLAQWVATGVLLATTPQSHARPVVVEDSELAQLRHAAQTARDVQEIQNLMSRRAMYHSIGHNEDELALWSQKAPVRWAQNQGCWVGMESLRRYYVTINFAMQRNDLKRLSEANPAIENDFARNRSIGTEVLHILTTPIIEVAQDGQTAKGFWYTPGAIVFTPDGKTTSAMNMWEKYGVDFIREDGHWRFLHVEVMTDFAGPWGQPLPEHQGPPAAMMGNEGSKGDAQGSSPGPGAAGLSVSGPDIPKRLYSEYAPTRAPRQVPRLPEPYETLSQTFEYADCGADQRK